MIVYRVAPQSMEIATLQVLYLTDASYFIEGRNGPYRASRTHGGARVFETKAEAVEFMAEREREKIEFFKERLKHHEDRLALIESM